MWLQNTIYFVLVGTKRSFIKEPRRRLETGQAERCRKAVCSGFCAVLAAPQLRPRFSVSIASAAAVNKMVSKLFCSGTGTWHGLVWGFLLSQLHC